MGLEENKAVVRRWYEEVHGGNLEAVEELVAETSMLHGPGSARTVTRDDLREIAKGQRAAFPDWKITIHQLVAEGDLVASELTINGTHLGQFRSFSPTGNSVSFNGFFIDRVEDGMITEMWHQPDYLRLLIQIGAVPEDILGG